MKKIFILSLMLILLAHNAYAASNVSTIWNKYANKSENSLKTYPVANFYSEIIASDKSKYLNLSMVSWKYKNICYEFLYENPKELAKNIYSLAIFANDIDASVSYDRFISGVQGFHYSSSQIANWINAVFAGKINTAGSEETLFIGKLIKIEAIILKNGKFVPGTKIKHVLAAAKGKKKTINENLRHERAHVYWDQDSDFKAKAKAKWNALSDHDKKNAKEKLKIYANFEQIIEEWSVIQVLENNIKLPDLPL